MSAYSLNKKGKKMNKTITNLTIPAPERKEMVVPESLIAMLSYTRAHGSAGEAEFCRNFISPVCDLVFTEDVTDEVSGYLCKIPNPDGTDSTTIWSAHTDTVHAPTLPIKQTVRVGPTGMIWKDDEQVLGADDGAGCWLLLEMIKAGVPGAYIFHRGEERGGIGSGNIAKRYKEWLGDYTHAIAFDRRDSQSVITHQSAERCCSDTFAAQFADLVMGDSFDYILASDDGGSFTDTAKYMDIIPECTNISIGYMGEHTRNETLDVAYLVWLRDRMIDAFKVPPALICARDPSKPEYLYGGFGGKFDLYGGYNSKGYDTYGKGKSYKQSKRDEVEPPTCAYDVTEMRHRDLVRWVTANPDEAADLLMDMAVTMVYELGADIHSAGYNIKQQ